MEQGFTIRSVANRFGVNVTTIYYYWRDKVTSSDETLYQHSRKSAYYSYDVDTILRACKQLKGESIKSVSKRMGICISTLNRWKWRYLKSKIQETTPEGNLEYNRFTKFQAYHRMKQGITAEAIAKELSIDVNFVRRWEMDCTKDWLQLTGRMKRGEKVKLLRSKRLRGKDDSWPKYQTIMGCFTGRYPVVGEDILTIHAKSP